MMRLILAPLGGGADHSFCMHASTKLFTSPETSSQANLFHIRRTNPALTIINHYRLLDSPSTKLYLDSRGASCTLLGNTYHPLGSSAQSLRLMRSIKVYSTLQLAQRLVLL